MAAPTLKPKTSSARRVSISCVLGLSPLKSGRGRLDSELRRQEGRSLGRERKKGLCFCASRTPCVCRTACRSRKRLLWPSDPEQRALPNCMYRDATCRRDRRVHQGRPRHGFLPRHYLMTLTAPTKAHAENHPESCPARQKALQVRSAENKANARSWRLCYTPTKHKAHPTPCTARVLRHSCQAAMVGRTV